MFKFTSVSTERGLGRLAFNVTLENFKQRKETKFVVLKKALSELIQQLLSSEVCNLNPF